MYQHILVAIEHSPADQTILAHVQPLARLTHARLLLLHVADGWAARAYDELQLRESEEMRRDREYLEASRGQPADGGIRRRVAPRARRPGDRRSSAPRAPSTWISVGHGDARSPAARRPRARHTVNRVRTSSRCPVLLLRREVAGRPALDSLAPASSRGTRAVTRRLAPRRRFDRAAATCRARSCSRRTRHARDRRARGPAAR